jgi:gliding motility-associated lipoprotein GldH
MSGQASKITFFVGILFVLAACSRSSMYDEQVTLPQEGWYKDELARFEVMVDDTIQGYDFFLNIRNNVEYRYSNLYLFMITKFPNGNISRDTLECILATPEGKWLGKGWGAVRENTLLLNPNMRFPLKGKYEFLFQQAMRTDTLKDIRDIGIRITKSE